MSTRFLSTSAAIFASLALVAKGAIVETDASTLAPDNDSSTAVESAYDTTVTSADILLNAPFTTSISGPTDVGFPISGINDGLYSTYDGSNAGSTVGESSNDAFFGTTTGGIGTTLDSSPTVTFTLNTSVNTNGYTLTSFTSDYGWLDRPPFSDQDYTISYSTVSDPTHFVLLDSVAYNPFSPSGPDNGNSGGGGSNSSLVTLTGLDVSNVGAIQIQFLPYNNGSATQAGQLVREMQLFGAPTEVPEPSTYALVGLGLLGLVVVSRRLKFVA